MPGHALFQWMLRHVAWSHNRFQPQSHRGGTPWEIRTGTCCKSPLLPFMEACTIRVPIDPVDQPKDFCVPKKSLWSFCITPKDFCTPKKAHPEGETKATEFPSERSELSAGRLHLEGAQIAPGDDTTYKALTDATRRPPVPSPSSRHTQKKNSSWMKIGLCSVCGARRGEAAGRSGMLADHLQPMLDTARDTSLLFRLH